MPPQFPAKDFSEYEGFLENGGTGDETARFRFLWLPEIIEKLASKHSVSQEEVEQVFANEPLVTFERRGNYPGENIYEALGVTDAGRYLAIYFVKKIDGRYLVVTAYAMKPAHRRRYERK